MDVSGPSYGNFYDPFLLEQQGQHIADPGVLYYDVSDELEKEKRNAEHERQSFQLRQQELQRALAVVIRERDEARATVSMLEQVLAKHNSQEPKPPDKREGRMQWADNKQGRNSSSPPLLIDGPPWLIADQQNRLEFPSKQLNHCGTSTDQQVQCSNVAEKQNFYQQKHKQHENNAVFQEEQPENPNGKRPENPNGKQLENTNGKQPVESPLLRLVEDPITGGIDVWHQDPKTSKALAISDTGGHMGYHQNFHTETTTGLTATDFNPVPPLAMPRYIPEPPEAEIQMMLKKLPENGKFLQAVMEAGPLLKNLLLAGPLPEWQRPPPSMGKVEVPMLSMESTPAIFHVDHMQPHMTAPQDPFFHPYYFHPYYNIGNRSPTDLQHPVMYQAGSSSAQPGLSSVNVKPIFSTKPPDCIIIGRDKMPKFRSKSYKEKNKYQGAHNIS